MLWGAGGHAYECGSVCLYGVLGWKGTRLRKGSCRASHKIRGFFDDVFSVPGYRWSHVHEEPTSHHNNESKGLR